MKAMASNRGAAQGGLVPRNAALGYALPEIFLHPGQQYVAASPTLLKMILGSCAGVFLFDSQLAIGGSTHYMLPKHGTGQASARYGDVAIPDLLERFRVLGSETRNLKA